MKEFNNLLKEIGLSRKEFAEMIGVTYKSMNVMMSKDNPPKWVTSILIVLRKLKEKGRIISIDCNHQDTLIDKDGSHYFLCLKCGRLE